MTQPPDPTPPSLHDVDERWTVPWALIEEEAGTDLDRAPLVWHGTATPFTHAGLTIERPMLYSADGRPTTHEASCIDTSLPVGTPDPDHAPPVPHWASYTTLTPVQRANYLQWLASGRVMPLRDINYAFLYFYGLERHALIDRGDPEAILRVLMKLLKHYDHAPSFFSCASRLAAFLFATKGIEKLKPAWFDRLFVKRDVPLHPDSISVALTWLYERKKPLPARLAFEIGRQDMRCPRSGPFLQDRAAFEASFSAAYTEQYGDGMRLQRAEKKQTWKYRPISPSLQSWDYFSKLWSVTSTDVAAEQSQFAPLVAIWRGCLDKPAIESPWTALVDAHINAEGRVLVPVRKLVDLAGVTIPPDSTLDLAQSLSLTHAAADAGFELLPNPRLLLRPYRLKERVALVRRPEPPQPEGEAYYLAGALLLALGAAMAEADGEVDHIEVLHVSEIVNSLYHFNDYDKHRLGILRKRLLRYPPKLPSLTRRVRAILSDDELAAVGKFLVGVAGANFHIGPEEHRALRRVYRAFGRPLQELDSLLAPLECSGAGEEGGPHGIDDAVLARYMRETKAFAARLGTAMQELEHANTTENDRGIWYIRRRAGKPAPPVRETLPDPYADALYALLQQPGWTEADLITLGEKHGRFIKGAIRPTTDWAKELAASPTEQIRLTTPKDTP